MKTIQKLKDKIIEPDNWPEIEPFLAYCRFKNMKTVFTNGCFDILHKGHVEYLAAAADMGDVLIIGLNSDQSVKKIKGKDRPVNDKSARSLLLASMKFVDRVIIFEEETPYELISHIKPDVLVKGSDYKTEDIVGADVVQANGGKVVTVELVDGYSTTNILNKLKE